MSLPTIGVALSFRNVKSRSEIARTVADAFLHGLVDPKSIQFTWMSNEDSDFDLYPGSLPSAPFNPDLFSSEYYPEGSNLSRLHDAGEYLRFVTEQDRFIDSWQQWDMKYQGREGELSFQIWGLVKLATLSDQMISHEWFLMESLSVQDQAVRVPLLEIEVKIAFNGDVMMYLSTHSLVWTGYSRIVDISASEPNENGYVAKSAAGIAVAQENICALAAALHRFADSICCSSWEWCDESEASGPDLARLLRDGIEGTFQRAPT